MSDCIKLYEKFGRGGYTGAELSAFLEGSSPPVDHCTNSDLTTILHDLDGRVTAHLTGIVPDHMIGIDPTGYQFLADGGLARFRKKVSDVSSARIRIKRVTASETFAAIGTAIFIGGAFCKFFSKNQLVKNSNAGVVLMISGGIALFASAYFYIIRNTEGAPLERL